MDGSIYEWEGVRSLLSDEGLRWLLRTLLDDYILSPVFQAVVCLFFGGGLFLHSGLGDACHRMVSGTRKFSRKEKRGMGLAAVTFLVYVGLCVLLAFGRGIRCVVPSVRCLILRWPMDSGECVR